MMTSLASRGKPSRSPSVFGRDWADEDVKSEPARRQTQEKKTRGFIRVGSLNLAQFDNLGLNFVTFCKHSAEKLSKTIWTDPCGILDVNELKRESVLIRASDYALPISHLKWQALFGDRKTPKPSSIFGADFAVHYRRYGLRLAAF
jgi:hypothetical protein